jgi:uncharacterized protein
MNKTVSIIIILGLVVVMGIIFSGGSKPDTSGTQAAQNVEIKNGVQYITIDAKGGYFPKVSNAKAGIPTKLIIKTNGTYDCSASLAIHSINYQKILPQTGETEIDLGTPKVGEPLQGVCGMGMYSFQVNF